MEPQVIYSPTPPAPLPARNITPLIIGLVVLVLVLLGFLFFSRRQKQQPKHITLEYWGLQKTPAVIQPLIDEYQASHPNVTINYTQSSTIEYLDRLQASLKNGTGPDIFRLHNTWVPQLFSLLSQAPSEVLSLSDFTTAFYPTAKQDLVFGNRIYGLPLEIDGLAMIVNEKILRDNNKPIPASWDELRQTAIAVSKCTTPNGKCTAKDRLVTAGAALGIPENVDHWQEVLAVLLMQNGVKLSAPSSKEAIDVLDFYANFVKKDHVWDASLPKSTQAFIQGKVAIVFVPSWRFLEILTQAKGFRTGIYPLPQIPYDPNRGESAVSWASYWAESVSKSSPNSAQAWDFLRFLSSRESQLKLYQLTSTSQPFGPPPAHKDLQSSPLLHPYLTPYLSQAPFARSWYSVADTFDGPSGINSKFNQVYQDALLKSISGSASEGLRLLTEGTTRILASYGLVHLPTPTK